MDFNARMERHTCLAVAQGPDLLNEPCTVFQKLLKSSFSPSPNPFMRSGIQFVEPLRFSHEKSFVLSFLKENSKLWNLRASDERLKEYVARKLEDALKLTDMEEDLENSQMKQLQRDFAQAKNHAIASSYVGWTPLHAACKNGNIEMMKMLIKNDKSALNVMDESGETPIKKLGNQ